MCYFDLKQSNQKKVPFTVYWLPTTSNKLFVRNHTSKYVKPQSDQRTVSYVLLITYKRGSFKGGQEFRLTVDEYQLIVYNAYSNTE